MSKAVVANARVYNKKNDSVEVGVVFFYAAEGDNEGKVVLHNLLIDMIFDPEDLYQASRLVLPAPGEVVIEQPALPAPEPIALPEPAAIEEVIKEDGRKKRKIRSWKPDRKPANALKAWTTKDEAVLIGNVKAMGIMFDKPDGKQLVFETTAEQLGRSVLAIRFRYKQLLDAGRFS